MSATKPGRETSRTQSSPSESAQPQKKRRASPLVATLRRAVLRVIFPFREQLPDNAVLAEEAVMSFLGTMAAVAGRSCANWRRHLEIALADCLGPDARKEFFDLYPVEDYYFAGVVALEAAHIRQLYGVTEADELLAQIADQIDRAAGRHDRVMSEMVFDVIGRIEMARTPTQQKKPYDLVTKAILRHLDIHKNDATSSLMMDKAFRHALGEPLAVGMQHWWQAFQTRFIVYVPPQPEPEEPEEDFPPPPPEPVRRRRLKRAPSLI